MGPSASVSVKFGLSKPCQNQDIDIWTCFTMLNECTHKTGSGKRTVIVCEGQFQVFKQQFSQLKTDLDIRNKPVSVFFSFFFLIQSQYWCVQLSHTSTCSSEEPNPSWIKRRLGLDYKASYNRRPQNGYYVHQRGQRAAPVAPQPRRRRLGLPFRTRSAYVKKKKSKFYRIYETKCPALFPRRFAKAAVLL